MKLLREIETSGAPSDYLFARVRCRRAALDLSGRESWRGPTEPRQALRAEYVWVYTQLNQRLRQRLLPIFEYYELRTLVIALRYLATNEPKGIATQLEFSLLHPQLRKILQAADQVTPLVRQLEQLLADDYPYFHGLTGHYLRQGPGGLEQALLGGCLQQATRQSRCRPTGEMLGYLLDMRNLLALYKHLHWQLSTAPPLLSGDKIALTICEKIWAARDQQRLLAAMQHRAGLRSNPETLGVEEFLLQGLSNHLRRAGRDPLQAGLILDYLWRCNLATRNRGLRLSGAPEPQTRAAEVAG